MEWQKRGIPHLHILLWFANQINPNDIDKIISFEIPDIQCDQELHDLVIRHMIHGPCGVHNKDCPCMKDKKCSKRFPKAFIANTQIGNDGYPSYRRRHKNLGGKFGIIKMKQKQGYLSFEVDNR